MPLGAVPVGKVAHLTPDNHATRKHPKVRAWLGKHPRRILYLTPTSASRLNAMERLRQADSQAPRLPVLSAIARLFSVVLSVPMRRNAGNAGLFQFRAKREAGDRIIAAILPAERDRPGGSVRIR